MLLLGCCVAYWQMPLYWVTVAMVPILLGVYFAVWRELGSDLRQRIIAYFQLKIFRATT
jgi:hypothetical protein